MPNMFKTCYNKKQTNKFVQQLFQIILLLDPSWHNKKDKIFLAKIYFRIDLINSEIYLLETKKYIMYKCANLKKCF